MSEFEIITITLSFIVGLGIAQLLSSFGAAVRNRTEHTLYWMPFFWGMAILLFSVQYWFALYDLNYVLKDWSWGWYAQMLVLAIALYLAGTLVLPNRAAYIRGSLLEDFNTTGRYSLLALMAYILGWIPANAKLEGGNWAAEGNLVNLAMASIILFVYRSRSSRVRLILTVFFYLIFGYALVALYSTPGAQNSPSI